VPGDETAEARILHRHLEIALYLTRRRPAPTRSWAERPLKQLFEVFRFLLEKPDPRWACLLP